MSAMLAHESLVHGTRILFRSFRVYGLDAVINLHTVHCQFLFGPTACCRHQKTEKNHQTNHKQKQNGPTAGGGRGGAGRGGGRRGPRGGGGRGGRRGGGRGRAAGARPPRGGGRG